MAKREALRDLQVRLAKRLQTAQSEGMSVDWLAVRAGGRNYLLPLGQSGEVVALGPVQPVPYTKPWFKGVLNVRGSLLGVVDLAGFVAASAALPAAASAAGSQVFVVTLNAALEVNCALLVDSLAGLRAADAFTPAPAVADAAQAPPAFFGKRLVDAQGSAWQEINVRALAQSAAFLSIGS
ncbi:MAG: chemotaxis protein CheW [Rhodoferax sp.]|nr:chemotaxis protein CheW [Rhodoferax sp.]